MSKRLLFLSHQASRTGAPFVLLHFLRWLKAHSDLNWEVIFAEDGDLRSEFEELSPVTVWKRELPAPSRLNRLKTRVQRRLGQKQKQYDQWNNNHARALVRQIETRGADLIYSNTLSNGPMLNALAGLNCPVICHAHELEYTIAHHIGAANFDLSDKRTDHYIAASHAVKRNLIDNHATPAEKIDVVHEFVPTQVFSSGQIADTRQKIRRELGISQDAPIVIGSGTIDWRKGSDLWLQMAIQVSRLSPVPVHFLWVGGLSWQPEALVHLKYDIAQAGLEKQVNFLGVRSNVSDYFCASDVFAMTSREDPYPLVNLEAASVGKPIVCFQNSGGTPELVEEDSGFAVPYSDVSLMSARVCELLNSPLLRQQMGERAAQKVRERHDVSKGAPKVLAIIERCLANAS